MDAHLHYFAYSKKLSYITSQFLFFVWLSIKEVNVWEGCWWLAGIVVVLRRTDTEQMGLSVWEPRTLLHCLSFNEWPVMQASTDLDSVWVISFS